MLRKKISLALGLNPISEEHYVYFGDNKRMIVDLKDLNNIVTSKSYGDEKFDNIYVDIGDFNPNLFSKNNIHPNDVKNICSKIKKNIKDKEMFAAGFIISRIYLYSLILNCYILNSETFIKYFSGFFIDNKNIVNFLRKFEFPLRLNKNLEFVLDRVLNSQSLYNIIMFETGYPRFTYKDLDVIFKKVEVNKYDILKIISNLQGDEFLDYLKVCLENCSDLGFGDMETYIILPSRKKNLLYEILSRQYTLEQLNKLKKILLIFLSKGGNPNIELDEYFSEEETKLFYENKNFLF